MRDLQKNQSEVLSLRFTDSICPELNRIQFDSPLTGTRHVLDRQLKANAFQWGPGAGALGLIILDYLVWANHAPAEEYQCVGAAKNSLAASIASQTRSDSSWYVNVFGETEEGKKTASRIFKVDRKSEPGKVRVFIDARLLPPNQIRISKGQNEIVDESSLRVLWNEIKEQFVPDWPAPPTLAISDRSRSKPVVEIPVDRRREETETGSLGELSVESPHPGADTMHLIETDGTSLISASDPLRRSKNNSLRLKGARWRRMCGLIGGSVMVVALVAFLLRRAESSSNSLTPEERNSLIKNKEAFSGDTAEVSETFSRLKSHTLSVSMTLSSDARLNNQEVIYTVPLVYRGVLDISPVFMRFDQGSKRLYFENAAIVFDEAATKLMPVTTRSIWDSSRVEKKERLINFDPSLAPLLIAAATNAVISDMTKELFRNALAEVVQKKLQEILPSGVTVQISSN